jgi:hypothetical protein
MVIDGVGDEVFHADAPLRVRLFYTTRDGRRYLHHFPQTNAGPLTSRHKNARCTAMMNRPCIIDQI